MGLGLLPLEKIPIFIWGSLLVMIGGFLAINEAPFSWPQSKALLLLLVGLCAVAYDIQKRRAARMRLQRETKQDGGAGNAL